MVIAFQRHRGKPRAWRARPSLLLVGAMTFAAAVYVIPMLTLTSWAFRDAKTGFTLAQAFKLVHEPAYITAFVTTFRTAAITTLTCALLGYPLAYLMATAGHRARLVLAAAVMIPFWTMDAARRLALEIPLLYRGPGEGLLKVF